MHDNNSFSISKRISENIKFNHIITNSQERLYNTTKINFYEPERKIGFTIVALEHQEARGGGDRR